MRLSTLDCKVLNCIQQDIPLSSRPFEILSKEIGIKESQLLGRIKWLKDKGIIHSLAGRLNHKKLGFKSTLIGLRVPLNKVESLAKEIASYQEVTHCYWRQGEYNLWSVFLCTKKEKMKKFITKLTKQIGQENILNLSTKKQFKLKNILKIQVRPSYRSAST